MNYNEICICYKRSLGILFWCFDLFSLKEKLSILSFAFGGSKASTFRHLENWKKLRSERLHRNLQSTKFIKTTPQIRFNKCILRYKIWTYFTRGIRSTAFSSVLVVWLLKGKKMERVANRRTWHNYWFWKRRIRIQWNFFTWSSWRARVESWWNFETLD